MFLSSSTPQKTPIAKCRTMEKLQAPEKSKQEKNSLTATNSSPKDHLKVLNFSTKEEKEYAQNKEDIMDLLTLAGAEVELGKDLDLVQSNCGLVILANIEGETLDANSITIYSTKSSPIKLIGILEYVKNQILNQS